MTNMLINSFVPASVTLAKMIMTKFMRWCGRGRVAHQVKSGRDLWSFPGRAHRIVHKSGVRHQTEVLWPLEQIKMI